MGRAPCCSKVGLQRGPWSAGEDALLINYIKSHGEGNWRALPKNAGLLRCGKSCRLRWMNYLRPDIKRGNITPDEEELIVRLHRLLGNRWSLIAGRLPGRTDNEIKNYWNTHLTKRIKSDQTILPQPNQITTTKKGNKKKKLEKKDNCIEKIEEVKVKIHLPRPVRVSSRVSMLTTNDSVLSNDFSSSDPDPDPVPVVEAPWLKYLETGSGAFLADRDYHYHDLIDGPDLECESQFVNSDSSLERLCEEYLQLLEKDETK